MSPSIRRWARRSAAASVLAAAALMGTATGAVAALTPIEGEVITLVLRAPDSAALQQLALTSGITREERIKRLKALLPTETQKAAAVAYLEANGFDVTDVGSWVITATAATANQVHARFGANVTADAAAALPVTPPSLDGLVSAVYSSDTPGGQRKHAALPYGPTGSALRSSYAAALADGPSTATIATLQYAGWNSADLTKYAADTGIADPVSAGRYVGVPVGGRQSTARVSGDGDGDSEVALDQQALLSVAPNLKQRAYFTKNDDQGELAALQKIADDAMDPAYNMVALSISWGMCEDYYFNNGVLNTDHLQAELDAFNAIAAAGVTIFAASGDSGAFDCAQPGDSGSVTTQEAVDTPAAFPSVVGVGGTSMSFGDPSTAADDAETVWASSSGDGAGYYLGDAGGGGLSRLISQPAYQKGLSYSKRAVPDISALADGSNHFAIYWARGGGWVSVGGTSLAAPLSAGLFASELVAQGATAGIGSIHDTLYNSPSYTGTRRTLRDVTSGDISFGRNPAFTARSGYDLASGLGSPQWHEVVTRALESVTVTAPDATKSTTVPVSIHSTTSATFTSWKVQALNAAAPDPGCLSSVTASATPPTSVELPAGDGAKVIYVAAFDDEQATTCHSARTTVVVDNTAPTPTLKVALKSATSNQVVSSWSANDGSAGSGIDHYSVTIKHTLQSAADVSLASTTATSRTLTGVGGRTYTVTVTAYDRAGNSRAVTKTLDVPLDDGSLSRTGSWKRVSSTSHYGSAASVGSTAGSTLSGRLSYKTLAVQLATGRNNGLVDVLVDGKLVKTLNTYSSATAYRKVFTVQSLSTAGMHTVTLKVRGVRPAGSSGTAVVVDALLLHS